MKIPKSIKSHKITTKKEKVFIRKCPLCTEKYFKAVSEIDVERQYNNHYFFIHSKVEDEDD